MKTLKLKWYSLLLILFALQVGFTSCDDESDNDDKMMEEETNTIVDIAVAESSFSILVDALTKANLVGALNGTSQYTVFAPTNDAFTELLNDLGASSLDDIPVEDLTEILLYHVVAGSNESSALSTGYYASISPKGDYYFSIYFDKENLKINGSASVTQADVMADNGIIHIIDKVILPPSITDHAIANPALSSLTAAVVKAELAETLDDVANNFTVFAPINDAFAMLLEDLNASLDDLSKDDLTPILLNHVVNAFVPAEDVTSGYVSTLATGQDNPLSINIQIQDNSVMINNSAQVVLTDVVATNGIIHVVDKVIVPNNVVDIAINNSAFSILVEAVVKAELVETLSGAGPFTVFAPNNAAFEALFAELEVGGISDLSKETLTPILLAHVVSGNVRSADLSNGDVKTLNEQKMINVDVTSGVVIDSNINVLIADVQGTNGVVHAIDKVIVP